VPPTVLREEGPHGVGSMQLFIPNEASVNYFTLRTTRLAELQRFAVFDVVTNNADRKGGHCLLGHDGRLWGIDHGLTFNSYWKLRTVIWDFQGEPVPPGLLADVAALAAEVAGGRGVAPQLAELIDAEEMNALRVRLDRLLEHAKFPEPHSRRSVPWPPV